MNKLYAPARELITIEIESMFKDMLWFFESKTF